MSKKKVIVSVTNDLVTDQRVRKVCEFLVHQGFDITLVGRKLPNSADLPELTYRTKRFPLWFKKGPMFYATYNLRLFFYLLFHRADVLLSNDLDTLYANQWARKFKSKCALVYDSHEYYCETPELINRPKVQKLWRKIEKRSVLKVDAMYTVNQSIANIYSKQFNRKVEVVRNITDRNQVKRTSTRSELGLPLDKKVVILQGAGINVDRGAEEMVEAIQFVDNAVLAILGGGDVIPELKAEVKKNNWGHKVLFFGKRPYDELLQFTVNADIGVSFDKDTNPNYRYALGNKIFDFINCCTPLFVSDLPEVGGLVSSLDIGMVCSSYDPTEIAKDLNNMLSSQTDLDRYKKNLKLAAQELTWENEKKVLLKIYKPFL